MSQIRITKPRRTASAGRRRCGEPPLPWISGTPTARAAGLFGARVEKASELDDALRAAFTYDGPTLVDVRTARQELSLPPKLTYGQIKGFTLYATRTILSGEGSELIELTKTNLRELEVE